MEEAAEGERKRLCVGEAAPSAAAAAAAAAAEEPQYVYLAIADALKAPGARVCLFAVVSEIGAAFRSRGTGEPHSQPLPLPSCRAPAAGLILGFSPGFSRDERWSLAVCA